MWGGESSHKHTKAKKKHIRSSTMQRIKQGDVIASDWGVVLDYGVRKGLCEEGIFELSSEQHKPDHEGANLETNNLGRENIQANAVGADMSLACMFKDQKEGGCGRGRVGQEESGKDTYSITWHLTFLPATSATKTYHLHLQQIWTLSHGSVFYFFLAGKKYESERQTFEDHE